MQTTNRYQVEYVFLTIVVLLSVTGFWKIYFGAHADPTPYHHLHVITNASWLSLLAYQLHLVGSRQNKQHRRMGLLVLFFAPMLVASTALLSVYSAHKGVVSGEGDFLIIQNVGVTIELAFAIIAGFVMRKRRQVHGAFMMSTALLFMGIALFFTLISFVPGYKVEGPETVGNFAKAGITGQGIVLVIGVLFAIRDFRNGWPLLLTAAFFPMNELIRSFLSSRKLIDPLTEFVGSLNQPLTFVGTFAVILAMLFATGMRVGGNKDRRLEARELHDTATPA